MQQLKVGDRVKLMLQNDAQGTVVTIEGSMVHVLRDDGITGAGLGGSWISVLPDVELVDPLGDCEREGTASVLKDVFPHDSSERKTYPVYTFIAGYFPSALAALANHSYENNQKHNPGEDMHWSRDKSNDHLEAAMRHLIEGDLEGLAWRALAALQLKLEGEGHPVPFAAR